MDDLPPDDDSGDNVSDDTVAENLTASPDEDPFRFPRRPAGRFGLFLVALPLAAMSIVGLVTFVDFLGPARGFACHLLRFIVGEILVAAAVVSSLCLVWAVSTPPWVERTVRRYSIVLVATVFLFIPGFFLFMSCMING